MAGVCGLIFALHLANHGRRGDGWEIFWACSWVPLMVGAAVLVKSARLNAIGLVWLALGNLLWGVDLLAGGEWMWTSTLTHWGALGLGLWAARWLGFPPGSWWRAHLCLLGWQQFTRLFTPPERNINVAFAIHPASRDHFTSFPVYWVTLFFADALVMYAGERLYRRLLRRPGPG
ncbi:MAG: hypothetical protein MUF64_23655 [Polyangiaceae bacterium]|nr:hypothetical protein [Polyangiaceae bacterium]